MRFFNKKTKTGNIELIEICCPINGEVKSIEQVSDPVFSKKMMGDGVMIIPNHEELYAPCDAVIEMIFPTRHAIGLRLADNTALLLHFGLETVALNGKGFEVFVKKGQKVAKGKLLMKVDLKYIKDNAIDDCVIMAFSEMKEGKILTKKTGDFLHGQPIIEIR